MPTINFALTANSVSGEPDPDSLVSGVDCALIAGATGVDRLLILDLRTAGLCGVPPGAYEHVTQDSNGNWTYAPANR